MKRTTTAAMLLLVVTLPGCGSLAPGAESIKLTREPKDVAGCTVIGDVNGLLDGRYGVGAKNRLINRAHALGADTVFLTSTAVSAEGTAYRCKPK